MTISELATALVGTGYRFAHYAWSHAPAGDYGTYAEESGEDFEADGVHAEKALEVAVDYFTRDDTGTPQTTIEAVLDGLNVPWYLDTIQYEDTTGYIHYTWIVGVV